jgi:hypothetical protein
MNPFAFWGGILWQVERQFAASHPPPRLPPPPSQPIAYAHQARNRHALVTGVPGSGKSVLLTQLVGQEIISRLEGTSNRGVIVVDTTGDIVTDLKPRFAVLASLYPELYELFILIDPTNLWWTARFNPLEPVGDQTPYDRAVMLADTINAVYQDEETVTVQLRLLLINSFLTIMHLGLSMLDVPRLLMDEAFRAEVVSKLPKAQPALYRYWTGLFPQKDAEVRQYIASTLNRLLPLTDNPRLAGLFQPPATVKIRQLLDRGCIVLVNAPKGTLSPMGAYLLCGLLLAEISQAAQSRTNIAAHERRPCMLVCDEYQSYATKSLVEIITENRKFGLELILASQQIVTKGSHHETLQRQVHKTVGTLVHFRASSDDAEVAVDDLFSFAGDEIKYTRYNWQKPYGMDVLYEEAVFYDLSEKREMARSALVDLLDREFFVKQRGFVGAVRGRTLDMPPAPFDPHALTRFEAEACRRFGAPRADDNRGDDEPPLIPPATVD